MSSVAIPFPPILREGDRMDAAEFLRRWEAMPDLKFAELIDGTVFMASPLSDDHGVVDTALAYWLFQYVDATPGTRAASNGTWLMRPDSVPQPDLALRILPDFGGQSKLDGKYPSGAPELAIEISASSTSRDLGIKLELYRKVGVQEYLTVLLRQKQVVWRQLVRGRYKELLVHEDGLFKSEVFPGLWLDPETVWSPEGRLRKAAKAGLKSPEHAAFVRKLQSKRP